MLFAMITNRLVQCFVLLLALLKIFAFAQVGDPCKMRVSGARGTCRPIRECPVVEQQAENGVTPTFCGAFFRVTAPVICCENEPLQPNDNSFISSASSSFIYPEDDAAAPAPKPMRKSEEKCKEYLKLTMDTVSVIPLITKTDPINVSFVKCEFNGVGLIVGGQLAEPGEFPFMAALGFNVNGKVQWRCGATLISDRYVLTAAHCAYSRDAGEPKVVRLGELDLSLADGGDNYVDYPISEIKVHPNYRYPNKYNDIALVKLNRKIEFTSYIRPACLYTKNQIDQAQAIATGWGKTEYAATDISSKLMKVSLELYKKHVCERVHLPSRTLPQGIKNTMICAGELRGGKDTCQGDSGGPLLITKKDNQCLYYVIGVTSFGKSCGQTNTAAVYTKVSEYVPWIENTIW